jgi:bacterial/archaeal transporter family-2 protein
MLTGRGKGGQAGVRYLLVLLMMAVGAFNAVQAPVVASLSRRSGVISGVTMSFLIAAAFMLVLLLATRSGLPPVRGSVWWEYLGGFTAATFVLVTTFLVYRIGLMAIIAANVTAQLSAGMLIDRMGWFGLERVQVSWVRVVGGLLLMAGALMVARK